MSELSFMQRFGLGGTVITDDFPEMARQALLMVFYDFWRRDYIWTLDDLVLEARRTCGPASGPIQGEMEDLSTIVLAAEWPRIFQLCERVYSRCLKAPRSESGHGTNVADLQSIRDIYTDEMNTVLSENSMGYSFADGAFERLGHPSTQKATQRVGSVLSQPRFDSVLKLYLKALRFFQQMPEPDSVNCIKEAICALEACLSIVTDEDASKQFDRALRSLRGNGAGRLPGALAEGMLKLYGYRGDGQGVAHAALDGSYVSPLEAELVLTLVSAYITYLADLVPEEEEIPF